MGRENQSEQDPGFIGKTIIYLASKQVVQRASRGGYLRRGSQITLVVGAPTSAVGVTGVILDEKFGLPVASSGLALNTASICLRTLDTVARNLERDRDCAVLQEKSED